MDLSDDCFLNSVSCKFLKNCVLRTRGVDRYVVNTPNDLDLLFQQEPNAAPHDWSSRPRAM